MISPFGFDTRPRMPTMLRTCSQLPRAPEDTIRLIVFSFGNAARMASATSSVAFVQIFTNSARRAWSVIKPVSYSSCTPLACSWYFARISFFSGGVTISDSATVAPDRVAQWKPASLILSRVSATMTFG